MRARYDKFKNEQDKISFQMKIMEQENERTAQQLKREHLLNKSKVYKEKQKELLDRIKYNMFNFS